MYEVHVDVCYMYTHVNNLWLVLFLLKLCEQEYTLPYCSVVFTKTLPISGAQQPRIAQCNGTAIVIVA